jgi:SAM-dependent methyltransferase
VGRNLESVRQRAPTLDLQGIDVNAAAVAFGRRERRLNLARADETFFQEQAEGAFDVVFTVSVLDHLASPKPVLAEMVRVAHIAVLLLEPTLGEDGKVVRNIHPSTGQGMETTPFTYSWDYRKLSVGLPIEFSEKPYPLSGTNLGPYYVLFRLVKK